MKGIWRCAATVCAIGSFVTIISDPAFPIRRAGGGGWGATTQYGSLFNPSTIESISGEVVGVNAFTPFRRMASGYLVTVTTDTETVSVHVGPAWYVDQQGFMIEPGDIIGVIGSRITYNEAPAIMAMEVHKGEEVIILRDRSGVPPWSAFSAAE